MLSAVAKLVYVMGAKRRNPSVFQQYRALKDTEFATTEELEKIQISKLQKLATMACNYSDFYKSSFQNADINPESITLEQLSLLPTISKRTLIDENSAIHTNYPFKRRMLAETSGTSGEALAFYRNEEWDSLNRANVMRNYDWYGVKVWDKNGYFWGYNIDKSKSNKIRFLDALQNRKRIFNYNEESIAKFTKDLAGAKYLSGYSSMLYQVAKKVNSLGMSVSGVKMVKGTSEMILPAYQPEVMKAFGCKMISEYGAAESGLIAFECPEGNMHINMESVIVETDENNEIIVTNLGSLSFPIIRYRLGDIVKLREGKCKCGRSHQMIGEILGRKGSNIEGKSSSYPALTFYYVFKNIALENDVLINYKAEQYEPGKVVLIVESDIAKQHETLIQNEMEKYFGADLEYELKYVSEFTSQKKKQQYFESFI